MSLFGWLFGGSDSADKAVESISSGIDKMFFTDEEKADASREGFKLWLQYQEATQPQNRARRGLAFIVAGMWALCGILYLVAATKWNDYAQAIVWPYLENVVSPAFMLVMTFYFFKRIVAGFGKNGDKRQ